jgi:tRNA A-37 threonylcarbamoyl transferase component Bud32/tetratricopeptide (TPR) repeat protein
MIVSSENLLFGILALQNGFVTRDQLVAAAGAWIGDKQRTLESIFVEQGALDEDERQLLAALVRKHVANHDNDPEQSLRSLSSIDSSVRNELTQLNDSLLTRDVEQVSLDRKDESIDPYSTHWLPAPRADFAGLRFRVLRPHARGGLGKVSVALDGELNREVAFKELLDEHADSPSKRSRFLVEAEITGALEHPGIVPVYGLGHYADGRPFYAMRFIQGDSLKEAIEHYHNRRGAVDEGERTLQLRRLLARFIDVCEAIEYAHSRGVLHRDLKPGNIMLGKYGETLVVDWGLAKAARHDRPAPQSDERPLKVAAKADTAETRMGTLVGTPSFMPPEQAEGKLDLLGPASDVYSLGATLYCLLTGKAPFTDETVEEVLSKVRKGAFPRPRDVDRAVPKALESICLKAMALRPEDRYASAQALADDVEHWQADEPVAAHRETAIARAGRWMRRHRSWTMAGAATLVAVSAIALIAALAINAERQRVANERDLSDRMRLFDARLSNLEQSPEILAPETLQDLYDELGEMAEVPVTNAPSQAQLRREKLRDAYARELMESLNVSPFTDEDRDVFNRRLELLANVFVDELAGEDLLDGLASRRDDRMTEYYDLFSIKAPFETQAVAQLLHESVTIAQGSDRLTRTDSEGPAWIATSVACPSGNIQLSARFDSSWRSASAVGITLNYSDEHRYDFLVAVPDFDFRAARRGDAEPLATLGEIADRLDAGQVHLVIARDGEILRRAPLEAGEGPLRLDARRAGNRLAFGVNNGAAIEVLDPFALPVSAQGRFAVYWPPSVQVEQLAARWQRAARETTPMEQADLLYARNEIYDALPVYQSIANSPEAQYKAGLCLERMGEEEKYLELMKIVADQSPQEATQWQLLAAVRLMKAYADNEDVELYRDRLHQIASRYDFKETARLLPASDRELLFQDIRREGQRSRIALSPEGDVDDLLLAVELDQAFNENAAQRRDTRWRLADAYRVDVVYRNNPASYANAEEILRELIEEQPGETPVSSRERTALVSDLVWTFLEQGKTDEARREVERWLLDSRGSPRNEYLPLLIDRARLAYLAEDRESAMRDLDEFFARVDEKKTSHAEFAAACLLKGMIHEDLGNAEDARAAWLRALYRNWRTGAPDPAEFAEAHGVEMVHLTDSFDWHTIATSWTGELTPEEALERLTMMSSGGGMGAIAVERIARAAASKELIHEVALGMYQAPPGRQLGRDKVLRRLTLRETHIRGGVRMLYLGVMRSAFRNETPTPEEDQYVLRQCEEMVRVFEQESLTTRDMTTILDLWQGERGYRDWQKLSARFPGELTGSLSYFFGRMHRLHGKPESARQFFRAVLENPDSHSFAKEWTNRDLKLLDMPPAPTG